MPAVIHRRLLNEAVLQGSEEILKALPSPCPPELEEAVRRAVKGAVLHYADGLDTLDRQLRPLAHARPATALEVARRAGVIGCADGLPPDLSTGKGHFEDFGR
jgi:hypothetical protein